MARPGESEPPIQFEELVPALAAALIAALVLWLLPVGAALVHSQDRKSVV